MSETVSSKAPELELVKEHKLYELLPGSSPDERFEAYSVCWAGDHYFVIFEDTPISPEYTDPYRQAIERISFFGI